MTNRDELITFQALVNSVNVDLNGSKGDPLTEKDIDDLCTRLSSVTDDMQLIIDELCEL